MQYRRPAAPSGVLAEVVLDGEVMSKPKCVWCASLLAKDGECNSCGNPQELKKEDLPLLPKNIREVLKQPGRYMVMQLYFDSESFNDLKDLLREASRFQGTMYRSASEEPPAQRRRREALERVFRQIRDVEYRDG